VDEVPKVEGDESLGRTFLVIEDQLEHRGRHFHAVRHEFITNWLKSIYKIDEAFSVLDLGCAQGKLTADVAEIFKKAKITAVDGDPRVLSLRAFRPCRSQVTPLWENILFPTNPEKWVAEVVLFCEVIEHFPQHERNKVLRFILRYLRPKRFVLTTPNIEYNSFIQNLNENGFRHPGHFIEYTPEEFKKQ